MFHKDLLTNEIFDGMWVAPLVEHLAIILSRLAVVADAEALAKKNTEEEKKEMEKDPDDPNNDEESKFIKEA